MIQKNYILAPFLLLLVLSGIVFAGATLSFIRAHSESDNIIVEWQTEKETNIKSFFIQRKTPDGSFTDVGSVAPTGDYSYYRFVDQGVYKTADRGYTYRLKMIDNNGFESHSQELFVTLSTVSGVRRTWGSIKALFR